MKRRIKRQNLSKPKASRKAQPRSAKRRTAPAAKKRVPPGTKGDALDGLVLAGAAALGLTIDPAWQANVTFNLALILRHAKLVDEFPLADDAEPAPVFHA